MIQSSPIFENLRMSLRKSSFLEAWFGYLWGAVWISPTCGLDTSDVRFVVSEYVPASAHSFGKQFWSTLEPVGLDAGTGWITPGLIACQVMVWCGRSATPHRPDDWQPQKPRAEEVGPGGPAEASSSAHGFRCPERPVWNALKPVWNHLELVWSVKTCAYDFS